MGQKIGEIISKSRRDRQMTQEEFAMRLGVTPQAVSKWERELEAALSFELRKSIKELPE